MDTEKSSLLHSQSRSQNPSPSSLYYESFTNDVQQEDDFHEDLHRTNKTPSPCNASNYFDPNDPILEVDSRSSPDGSDGGSLSFKECRSFSILADKVSGRQKSSMEGNENIGSLNPSTVRKKSKANTDDDDDDNNNDSFRYRERDSPQFTRTESIEKNNYPFEKSDITNSNTRYSSINSSVNGQSGEFDPVRSSISRRSRPPSISREATLYPKVESSFPTSGSDQSDQLLNRPTRGGGGVSGNSGPNGQDGEPGVEKWPFFLINISLLFVNCAGRFHSLVMDQYMYQDSARLLLGNDSIKTSSHPCLNESIGNSSQKTLVSQVESLTSTRLLHLDLTSYGIGIFANIILGSFSTVLNRKVQLLVPTFGYLVRNLSIPAVIFWKLDINWLFVGYAVDGLCGNACGIYFGSYLYTTDITPRNRKRTLSMAILMAGKGTVTASLNVVTGHIIQSTGFFIPAAISAGCVFISIVTVLFLPNRKPPTPDADSKTSGRSMASIFGTLCMPFRSGHDARVNRMVALGCVSFLATMIAHFGFAKIRTLFLMNLPFCLNSSLIGWFLFAREFASRTFIVVCVATLHRCLPGITLAILGSISYLGGQVMYTVAQTDVQLFLVPAIAIGQSLPLALIRGELSRLLDSSLQGPLFAALAVFESISFAVGSLYLFIYKASLQFFPRLVFILGTAITAFVVVCLVWFQVTWRQYVASQQMTRDISRTAINNNDIEESPKNKASTQR